jgi:hypothetical protein
MRIELKNIKFSEAMSEETSAFTANLYINGKKVGYCKNNGQGGCTDYNSNSPENRKIIAKAETYCKKLPKVKSFNMEYNQSLESVIDTLLEDWLKAKETKTFERRMKTCILTGSPDENRTIYSYFNFKKPLSSFKTSDLQGAVNRIKGKLKGNDIILNTNLSELGIKV